MIEEIEPGYFSVGSFDEVKSFYKQLFTKRDVTTLYKIRNWRERFHPEFLTNGEIYFTKPSELNDPFDIHRPFKFDTSIIDNPEFLQKLIEQAPDFLGTNPGRDSQIASENYLNEVIKKNPELYFLNNYERMVNESWFNDHIGVFSLTYNVIDEQLWGYYGGGLKGYAVGFDPMLITESLFAQGFFVNYNDEIKISGIINQSLKSQSENWFSKNTKWQFE